MNEEIRDRNDSPTDYLVVGAGLAGLAFARDVQARGASVRLLDKGRGVGGRTATRRNGIHVDHGAPCFTATAPRLCDLVTEWQAEGWLRVWTSEIPRWESGVILPDPAPMPRYAPPGGMNALPKRLADGLDVRTSVTVTRLERDGIWRASDEAGQSYAGHRLILNLPPTQWLSLARDLFDVKTVSGVENVMMSPCCSAYYKLEADLPVPWPCLTFTNHPIFRVAVRDHTKRPPNAPPVLVLHAAEKWTRTHLEETPDAVAASLAREWEERSDLPLAIAESKGHRWRYAFVSRPYPAPAIWDAARGIGVCGDWFDTPRSCDIEGALESGWSLAQMVGETSAQNATQIGQTAS